MKTDNELIAEFMGATLITDNVGTRSKVYSFRKTGLGVGKVAVDKMQFNTSWDWLMPVVIKCHEIGDAKEKEFDSNTSDLDDGKGWRAWSYRRVGLSTDIDQVYKNVVEFIKWYNSVISPTGK